MNLRKSLLDLLSRTKGVDTSNLTQSQQYNIELLEQRIMYSATQAGAALGGDAGIDYLANSIKTLTKAKSKTSSTIYSLTALQAIALAKTSSSVMPRAA